VSARFAILNPCQKRWTDLSGDGRKRFCGECQTDVHALDQYSIEEFAELKRKSGRVCGFLGGESLPEPRSRRAILIGVFFTAISPLMAQSGRVRIRVTDASGTVIPQAQASLIGGDGKPTLTVSANEVGEIVLTDLPIGESRLRVSRPGFKSLALTLTVQNSDELKVDAKLEVGAVGGAVQVEFRGELPLEPPAELPHQLTLPAPKMVAVPPPVVSDPGVEIAQSPRPKRRWWHIFR